MRISQFQQLMQDIRQRLSEMSAHTVKLLKICSGGQISHERVWQTAR